MSLASKLNRPGLLATLWRPAYEFGYGCLRGVVAIVTGPLFRVRRIGPAPRLPSGGVILTPNHASYLDPGFVQLVLRRRLIFMMTNAFYLRPGGRWFFRLVGAVPVGKGRLARDGLRRAIALVRRGHAVVIFPEGRLSLDGTMAPPQRGVAILARRTGAPVYPVAIVGSMPAWPRGARRPGRAHVRVAFAKPLVWPGRGNDAPRRAERAFARRVMGRVSRLVESVLRQAPAPGEGAPSNAHLQKP